MRDPLRPAERVLYRRLLRPRADRPDAAAARPWSVQALAGYEYCLLVSFKRDGSAVSTPVWFAPDGEDRIVIRSGAGDGKVKRLARAGGAAVLVAPCDIRGRVLGPAMEGWGRVLAGPGEEAVAEAALRRALGWRRRAYQLVRAPLLDAAYLEVRARPS